MKDREISRKEREKMVKYVRVDDGGGYGMND